MRLYALQRDDPLAAAVAAALDEPLAPHEERRFEDGECKLRPLSDPRGEDAFVLASLHDAGGAGPHDRIWRLLMLCATLRDHGAARVSAVLPYLAYARKDERTKPHDPLSLRLLAQLLQASGVAQVLALEPHNVAAFENAFACPVLALSASPAFDKLLETWSGSRPLVVASPDPGGVKRALRWREELLQQLGQPVGFAMIDKRRSGGALSGGEIVAGEVTGATVLLRDDLLASGRTLAHAAAALRRTGAHEVVAFAAHGLFAPGAEQALAEPALSRVVVTDSVCPRALAEHEPVRAKLLTVSCATLLARAVADTCL